MTSMTGPKSPPGNGGSGDPGYTGDTRQLVEEDSNEKKRSSLPLASFNYINSIIGSGMIGMPYALHQAGFGLGLILLVLVAIITDYSLVLMVRAGILSGTFSYQQLMRAAFGTPGFVVLSFLQFVYPFIAMVSYNVIVGDTVTKVIVGLAGVSPTSWLARREVVILFATLLITLPLSLYRDISRLAKVSFLSLVFIAFVLVAVFVRLGTMSSIVPSTPDSWRFANTEVLPAIGIMAFAFMCHHNSFLLYVSIEDVDQRRWDKVTHASVLTALIVAILFAIAGYATFTGLSQGDLLENYCWDDNLMNVVRTLFCITILLTYPIECFVTREVLESLLPIGFTGRPFTHIALTILVVVTTFALSTATDCLGIVLEINGVLAAVPLAYVLPALCYIRLEEGSLWSKKKIPALATAAFGTTVAVLGAISLFFHIKEDIQCSHGQVMPYCMANRTLSLDAF